jgi:H+-translocating NAD(P) transhydrogenase subunit beta
MAIGGADMPVVVSMLNSYSGWTTSASGFMLNNNILIISGALIGSSGAILSYIMCRAMNRSLVSVIMGGFGIEIDTGDVVQTGEIKEAQTKEVSDDLLKAKRIVIVPGFGMAVSQAQGAVGALVKRLKEMGKECKFCIHPVAGRLPGHMNVLLAEANVPYNIVHESEEINKEFDKVDVVLVIGANDIVNPDALENPRSPIAGMPVCEVWRAKKVFVIKRGMGKGYAAIENVLFFKENTRMYFGNASAKINELLKEISNVF